MYICSIQLNSHGAKYSAFPQSINKGGRKQNEIAEKCNTFQKNKKQFNCIGTVMSL